MKEETQRLFEREERKEPRKSRIRTEQRKWRRRLEMGRSKNQGN
jgi:hypothetical protein